MALPIILFHSSEGSDVAASGAGPATAITGTAAAHTGGAASTTITLTNSPDLSGVATDGSAALWMKTASGRQFSKITAADNTAKTVTVEDSFTIASGSAVNYAIGGKRATLDHADSRTLWADIKPGWTIQISPDAQTLTATIPMTISGDTTNGQITLRGEGPSAKAVIVQSANAHHFNPQAVIMFRVQDVEFRNSNATKTSAYAFSFSGGGDSSITFERCVFGDSSNTQNVMGATIRSGRTCNSTFLDCAFLNCTSYVIRDQQTSFSVDGCYFLGNAGPSAIQLAFAGPHIIRNSIFAFNSGDAINASSVTREISIVGCTIHGNGGDGVDLTNLTGTRRLILSNNNITANGGYGVRALAGADYEAAFVDYNNFGSGATANTSGARLNISAGANDLAVDPQYVDAAGGNFTIQNAAIKGVGFPSTNIGAGQSATRSYVDIGAAQAQGETGTGGDDLFTDDDRTKLAAIYALLPAGTIANASDVTAIKAKTDNLPADPASNTQVNTRLATAGYTAPDNAGITAIKAKTDNLPSDPASNTQVNTRLATSGYTAPDNSGIAAIKAKTDNLPADPASNTQVNTRLAATGHGLATEANATSNKDAILTAIDGIESGGTVDTGAIADAVLDEALSGHTTAGTVGAALSTASTGGVDVNLLVDGILDALLADHDTEGSVGAALSRIGAGTGEIEKTYTVLKSGSPLSDVQVRVRAVNDASAPVYRYGVTDGLGRVTFYFPASMSGATVYVWRSKGGESFTNPDVEEVP